MSGSDQPSLRRRNPATGRAYTSAELAAENAQQQATSIPSILDETPSGPPSLNRAEPDIVQPDEELDELQVYSALEPEIPSRTPSPPQRTPSADTPPPRTPTQHSQSDMGSNPTGNPPTGSVTGGLGLGQQGATGPTLESLQAAIRVLETRLQQGNASTTSGSGGGNGTAKTMKPQPFKGTETPKQAQDWIRQIRRYLAATKSPEDQWVAIALSYMIDDAAPFAERIEEENLAYQNWSRPPSPDPDAASVADSEDREEPPHYDTWQSFSDEFHIAFIDTDPQETARFELRSLKMETTDKASDHVTEFKNLARRTKYNEEALLDLFKDSLPSRLFSKLAELPKNSRPSTLKEWYQESVEVDRAYHQNKERTKHNKQLNQGSSGKTSSSTKSNSGSNSNQTHNRAQQTQSNQPRNNQNRGGYQGRKQGQRQNSGQNDNNAASSNVCFNCGKTGHWARKCPEPKKPRNQQAVHNRAQNAASSSSASTPAPAASSSSSSNVLDQFNKMNDDELDNHVRALQQLRSKRGFQKRPN